jgi:HAMP domain-containing protein
MTADKNLKRALDAIDDAKRALNRTKNSLPINDDNDILRAIRELNDAEDEIERALKELKKR